AGDERAETRDRATRDARPDDPELGVLDQELLRLRRELCGADDVLMIVRQAQRRERAHVEAPVADLRLPGLEPLARPEDDRDLRPLGEDAGHRHPDPRERRDDRDDPDERDARTLPGDVLRLGNVRHRRAQLRHVAPLPGWLHPRSAGGRTTLPRAWSAPRPPRRKTGPAPARPT